MHRTQSEFDDNLTFKVFIFQFINFYSSLIYVAFFKGRFTGYPGHYRHIAGNLRNEEVTLEILGLIMEPWFIVWQWRVLDRARPAIGSYYDR